MESQIGFMKKSLLLLEPLIGMLEAIRLPLFDLMKLMFLNFQWMYLAQGYTKHSKYLNTQKLEKQIDATYERAEHLLHFTDEIWIRNGKRINPKFRHQKREGWIYQPSLELCLMAPSTVLLKRELLEQCGLFDEELPVCEDYDLWLRITAHHQVSFLNEALMTRSGGHADQLSRKYWGMDRFRVQSIKKILANVPLRKEDEMATRRVLKKKCEILLNGFRKRGKTEEISYYESLIKTHC